MVDNFKKQLDRPFVSESGVRNQDIYAKKPLSVLGNFRVIQKIDKHNVKYVTNKIDEVNPKIDDVKFRLPPLNLRSSQIMVAGNRNGAYNSLNL